jgi:hypothetical protein
LHALAFHQLCNNQRLAAIPFNNQEEFAGRDSKSQNRQAGLAWRFGVSLSWSAVRGHRGIMEAIRRGKTDF